MALTLEQLATDLRAAIDGLAPPFLALPEAGWTAETLAYQRGAREAYQRVLAALEETGCIAPPAAHPAEGALC